ncbi:MAG: helix-turn-helix transcriptional regulator [Planctomycetes bacterium]|nr:helix-turn-helix transcriptional regulator [Planctomycetota bacterium]
MDALTWHRQRDLTMWSVQGHGFGQRCPPHIRWWNDNRVRQPTGTVVVQYLHAGQAVLREGASDHPLRSGDLFLFAFGEDSGYGWPPDRPDLPVPGAELLVTDHVVLAGAGLAAHWDLLRARQGSVIRLPPRSPFLGAMRAAAEPGLGPQPERVATLVHALAGVVEDAAGAERSPVAQAIDAILSDPCFDHNLKAIAERCGCSREHLGRMFQEQIGVPPGEWMRQRRQERALALLSDTDLSMAEVARRCGAGSLHRLARWTRASHRLPPLRLRSLLKTSKRGGG